MPAKLIIGGPEATQRSLLFGDSVNGECFTDGRQYLRFPIRPPAESLLSIDGPMIVNWETEDYVRHVFRFGKDHVPVYVSVRPHLVPGPPEFVGYDKILGCPVVETPLIDGHHARCMAELCAIEQVVNELPDDLRGFWLARGLMQAWREFVDRLSACSRRRHTPH